MEKQYLIELLLKKLYKKKWFNCYETIRKEVTILVSANCEQDAMQIAVDKECVDGWQIEGYNILNDKSECENGYYFFKQKTIVHIKKFDTSIKTKVGTIF